MCHPYIESATAPSDTDTCLKKICGPGVMYGSIVFGQGFRTKMCMR